MTFQAKLPSNCFKVIQYGFEIFQTVLSLNWKIIAKNNKFGDKFVTDL